MLKIFPKMLLLVGNKNEQGRINVVNVEVQNIIYKNALINIKSNNLIFIY